MDSNLLYNYHIQYENIDTNKLIGFSNWIKELCNPLPDTNIDTNNNLVKKSKKLAKNLKDLDKNYINFVCGFEGKSFYIDEKKTPGHKCIKDHLHINLQTNYPPKKLRNKIVRNKEYYSEKCYYLQLVTTTQLQNIGYCCKMNTDYRFQYSHLATFTTDQCEAAGIIALAQYRIKEKYSSVDRKQKILIELQENKPTSIPQVLDRVLIIYERENYCSGNTKSIENMVIHLSLKLGLITITDFKKVIMNRIKHQVFEIKI